MIYCLALTVAAAIGILTLRLITQGRFPFYLSVFMGTALGLGIVSQIIFYLQLLAGNFNHFLPPFISLALLGYLIWANKSIKAPALVIPKNFSLLILLVLAVGFWLEGNYYSIGGWDAWSCWNLKAKFIYLGEERWKDMFDPLLWRSNTGYPLGLPTMNVWFWQWSGPLTNAPMFNATLIALLTAGILLLSLQEFKISKGISIVITLAVFTMAFGNTLCVSQYSDILFSLYLLSAFVSYLLFVQLNNKRLLILTGLFIGLLSFTKNEGLAAAGILSILIAFELKKLPGGLLGKNMQLFIAPLIAATLPTVIFVLSIAPHSQAFINGFLSVDKPATGERLLYILAATSLEFISSKWMGLWVIAIAGIIIGKQKAFRKPLMTIGLFMACYLGVVLAYYQINTFFAIEWWIQYTFNRIIFALMPSVFLWMALSFFDTTKDA